MAVVDLSDKQVDNPSVLSQGWRKSSDFLRISGKQIQQEVGCAVIIVVVVAVLVFGRSPPCTPLLYEVFAKTRRLLSSSSVWR